ncbi:MAG: tetratricopeptide repeat protein [Myxococcota bacterium]
MVGLWLATLAVLSATDEQPKDPMQTLAPLIDAGRFDAALEEARARLESDPNNVEFLSITAGLASKLQRYDEARDMLQRALELDSNADDIRIRLVLVYLALGEREQARRVATVLEERHPGSKESAQVQAYLDDEPAEAQTRLFARADLTTGYDSNPTLLNDDAVGGAAGEIDAPATGFVTLDGVVGLAGAGESRPFAVLGRVRSTLPFAAEDDESDAVGLALPSVLSVSAIGRRSLSEELLGTLDLRYRAIFVDGFGEFVQHFVAPTMLGTYRLGIHRIRALAGAELRFFGIDGDSGLFSPNDSVTPRLALRDTIVLGDVILVADVGGRLNLDVEDENEGGSRFVGYRELSVLGFAQGEILEELTALAGVDWRARSFDDFAGEGADETVLRIFAGLRYRIDAFELHAEYGWTQSRDARRYDRQQISGGLRYWY